MSENYYKESDVNKVNDLVKHLLARPGIRSEQLLMAEGEILKFFNANLSMLKTLFKTDRFFPHLELNQVTELVSGNLYSRVSGEVLPVIIQFVNNTDFTFMDRFSETGAVSEKFRKLKLHEFVQVIFRNRDSRINMTGTFNIFKYAVIEKYMGEIFKRRGYIYNKLAGLYNSDPDLSGFIILTKTMLLTGNAVYLKFPLNTSNPGVKESVTDLNNNRESDLSYNSALVDNIIPLLPGIPEKFIRIALKSAFRTDMSEQDDIWSGLIFILNARFKNYRHISPVYRGAESADKSWFDIALKNAGYSGYEREIVEELYLIAGDNNW